MSFTEEEFNTASGAQGGSSQDGLELGGKWQVVSPIGSIGQLEIRKQGGGKSMGTAFQVDFFGDAAIVTAAHNFISYDETNAKKLNFHAMVKYVPARNGKGHANGSFEISLENVHFFPGYLNDDTIFTKPTHEDGCDIAIAFLPTSTNMKPLLPLRDALDNIRDETQQPAPVDAHEGPLLDYWYHRGYKMSTYVASSFVGSSQRGKVHVMSDKNFLQRQQVESQEKFEERRKAESQITYNFREQNFFGGLVVRHCFRPSLPGMSGAPVMNSEGKVIAVHVAEGGLSCAITPKVLKWMQTIKQKKDKGELQPKPWAYWMKLQHQRIDENGRMNETDRMNEIKNGNVRRLMQDWEGLDNSGFGKFGDRDAWNSTEMKEFIGPSGTQEFRMTSLDPGLADVKKVFGSLLFGSQAPLNGVRFFYKDLQWCDFIGSLSFPGKTITIGEIIQSMLECNNGGQHKCAWTSPPPLDGTKRTGDDVTKGPRLQIRQHKVSLTSGQYSLYILLEDGPGFQDKDVPAPLKKHVGDLAMHYFRRTREYGRD